ncbi:transglycosylase SLT domain-containing protein [Chromobacterium haemolyticum]|uniref:transglycosylase SLT domain-containing protein n=1 Tax=Chromobacterium haemolyticum TaxID=394935 RepID=UPI000685CC78|nr:lytic transglycosylase domain-containing protein [Chromobacterium haemolyticum]MDH0340726.1 lytic transglycosylase domain-containing protein [Chromobacterium haemolyticum]
MPNPFLRDGADPTERIYSDALNVLPTAVPPVETALPSSPPAQAPASQPKARRAASNIAPDAYRPLFEAASRKHKVPLNLLMALGAQESGFNPLAEGQPTQWGTAKGMMQYLDGTAAGLGINPFDPAQSVDAAARQFAERLAKGYSPEEAVQAHFAGDDRALWKDKTERYRQEVLERAADIKRFYLQRPADEPKPAARRDWALREAKGTEAGGRQAGDGVDCFCLD